MADTPAVPTPTQAELDNPSYHQSAADKPVDLRWPIPAPPEVLDTPEGWIDPAKAPAPVDPTA